MKVIIFDSGTTKIYLHINKIQRIYTHKFAHYTRTIVHLNDYQIFISDFQNRNFNTLIHNFISSNKNLKILKIQDLIHESNEVLFTLVDWVSEAMGDK